MDRYLDDDRLWEMVATVFARYGYSPEDCACIADVLLTADRMGIESHGVQRLTMYTKSFPLGRIKLGARPEVVRETPLSAVIDAHEAMGHPTACRAMQMAIDKAKQHGMGIVLVRNSNHYGIAGYYSLMAAKEGLLGMSMTNTEAMVVPTFARQPMMGTNPIAVSMPASPHPFHVDMATSVVPAGKMEVYAKAGKSLPHGWLIDENGQESTDPQRFLQIRASKSYGGINPVGGAGEESGGHKGFGMSLLVELMCSILGQGRTSNYIRVDPAVDQICHCFFAMDYGMFGDKDAIVAGLEKYLGEVRAAALADGAERIYVHGDKAFAHLEEAKTRGVKVQQKTFEEIVGVLEDLELDPAEYLREKAAP